MPPIDRGLGDTLRLRTHPEYKRGAASPGLEESGGRGAGYRVKGFQSLFLLPHQRDAMCSISPLMPARLRHQPRPAHGDSGSVGLHNVVAPRAAASNAATPFSTLRRRITSSGGGGAEWLRLEHPGGFSLSNGWRSLS